MTTWRASGRPGRAVDHIALRPRDLTRSLSFYREGIGLEVLNDIEAEGDYQRFFGVPATRLRSIFLGDRDDPDAGKLELVQFEDAPSPQPATDGNAHLLLSFAVDVPVVAQRLHDHGFGPVDVIPHRGVHIGIVRDPDQILVELVELVPEPE